MRHGPAASIPATTARIALAVVVAAGPLLASARPGGAAAAWKIQSSPNAPAQPNAQLASVACATPTHCFAVGSSVNGIGEAALIEQRTTGAWSVVTAAPGPLLATYSRLTGIACADSTHCVAVGDQIIGNRSGEFAEHWDGAHWTIDAFSVPASRLAGVACPSASLCFAVGIRYTQGGITPVIARWNGTAWTKVTTPAAPAFSGLTGVACSGTSSCFAVGGSSSATLIERWNGSTWSIVASPTTSYPAGLSAVACRSATDCFAVGGESGIPLAEAWNGTSWSIVPSDDPGDSSFADVACPTDTTCFAVGGYPSPLVERWNGSAFVTVTGTPAGRPLSGIACPTATSCVAVGGTGTTFAERWNGTTWSVTPSASPARPASALAAVTCPSANNCVAVGQFLSLTNPNTPYAVMLIERWNGHRWAIDPSAGPNAAARRPTGAACATATRCFAVGTVRDAHGFVEQWDGSHWTVVSGVESNDGGLSEFFGVTCSTATRCFAFGYSYAKGHHAPLVKLWNGQTWSDQANPDVDFGSLYDAACTGPTTCIAVGLSGGEGAPTAMIERRAAGKWSIMNAPAPGNSQLSQLSGVACPTATNCFAVGKYFTGGSILGPSRAFVEHWDGTRWRVKTVLNPSSASSSALSNVACRSTTDCVAVGQYTVSGAARPLIERWDGTSWSFDANPSPSGARATVLGGLVCPSANGCVAVGSSTDRNAQTTFVERHP